MLGIIKVGKDCEENLFENQKIVITVPASFDAVARELTVKAAESAGITVTLLEEPQAAFYAWLQENEESWRNSVVPGNRVLVCDIGGGTTDFSLIEVSGEEGSLGLKRCAVGKHILLGGDNFDLTLAFFLANKLKEEKAISLDNSQMAGLTHACRAAKEKLFNNPELSSEKITILGRGSSLIGGSIVSELRFENLKQLLLGGFFPLCNLLDAPSQKNRTGLRDFGLNYESDPAITKHLASFLSTHCQGDGHSDFRLPNLILFNGGVTKSKVIRETIFKALQNWEGKENYACKELNRGDPELAVAIGACWYGYVLLGNAIRIKAGSPHSYYIGIESNLPAVPGFSPPLQGLCVVPFGMEEGTESEIPFRGIGLVVGEETVFRFFVANNRKEDQVGQILEDINSYDLVELPELIAKIPVENSQILPGTLIPVYLKSVLSDIGTLELWCIEEKGDTQWKLEYEIRTVALS